MTTPQTGMYMVTPDTARLWLGMNYPKQRRLKRSTVLKYARDIKLGLWIGDNGQTMTFSSDGWLVDGQHRLEAIIEADATVPVFVIRSSRTAEEIMKTVDTGDKRRTSQFYDGPNKTAVSAAAKFELCLRYGTGSIKACHHGIMYDGRIKQFASVSEVIDYLEDNEVELQETVTYAHRVRKSTVGLFKESTVAALISIARFCECDEDVDGFIDDIMATTPRNDTNAYLIRYLTRARLNRGAHIDWITEMDAILRAYDAWREGRVLKKFGAAGRPGVERWEKRVKNARAAL